MGNGPEHKVLRIQIAFKVNFRMGRKQDQFLVVCIIEELTSASVRIEFLSGIIAKFYSRRLCEITQRNVMTEGFASKHRPRKYLQHGQLFNQAAWC